MSRLTWRPQRRPAVRRAVMVSALVVGPLAAAIVIAWQWWESAGSDRRETAGLIVAILSLIVTILAVGIGWLAWLRPRPPSPHRPALGRDRSVNLPALGVLGQQGPNPATGAAPGIAAGASLAAPTGALPARIRGRDDLLRELDRAMRRPAGPVHVLTGPGGVGKSTIALELCQRAQRRAGHAVWWISAKDAGSVIDGLVSLAAELGANYGVVEAIRRGAGRARDLLWELIAQARPGWLLVFDNADDPRVLGPADGTGWLRRSDRGLVLVTSRIRQARQWGTHAHLHHVDALTEQDAARLLLDAAPRAGAEADARLLARRLGCLPLPLHLAGTSLGSEFARWNSFAAFARAVDAVGIARVLAPDAGPGHDEDPRTLVMRTWEMSLDGLADHGIPQARPLLRLLSCYAAPTPVALSLLLSPAAAAAAGADCPQPTGDVHQWVEHGLRGLAWLSLIADDSTAKGTEPAVVVHPVIAETNRAHLDGFARGDSPARDAATIRRTAVALIAAAVDPLRSDDNRHWPTLAALAPHVRELLGSTAAHLDNDGLARLLTVTARMVAFHAWSGAEHAGQWLATDALAHAERLDTDHPATLHLRNELAWAIGRQDRWAQAEPMLRQVLHSRIRVLGTEHPDTLDTRHKLAWAVGKLGGWAAAEAALSAVRDVRVHVLGAEHPDTLHTRCCHAWAIGQCGRLVEAVTAYQDVIAVRARVLGEDHIETLDARHSLAEALVTHGRYRDGEILFRQVITARAGLLGPDHPETMDSRPRYWLACALRGQGRHREAVREFRRLLADQVQTLGPDHPAVQATRHQLRHRALPGVPLPESAKQGSKPSGR